MRASGSSSPLPLLFERRNTNKTFSSEFDQANDSTFSSALPIEVQLALLLDDQNFNLPDMSSVPILSALEFVSILFNAQECPLEINVETDDLDVPYERSMRSLSYAIASTATRF